MRVYSHTSPEHAQAKTAPVPTCLWPNRCCARPALQTAAWRQLARPCAPRSTRDAIRSVPPHCALRRRCARRSTPSAGSCPIQTTGTRFSARTTAAVIRKPFEQVLFYEFQPTVLLLTQPEPPCCAVIDLVARILPRTQVISPVSAEGVVPSFKRLTLGLGGGAFPAVGGLEGRLVDFDPARPPPSSELQGAFALVDARELAGLGNTLLVFETLAKAGAVGAVLVVDDLSEETVVRLAPTLLDEEFAELTSDEPGFNTASMARGAALGRAHQPCNHFVVTSSSVYKPNAELKDPANSVAIKTPNASNFSATGSYRDTGNAASEPRFWSRADDKTSAFVFGGGEATIFGGGKSTGCQRLSQRTLDSDRAPISFSLQSITAIAGRKSVRSTQTRTRASARHVASPTTTWRR